MHGAAGRSRRQVHEGWRERRRFYLGYGRVFEVDGAEADHISRLEQARSEQWCFVHEDACSVDNIALG